MNDESIAKREAGVEGKWGRQRPNSVWMDGVRKKLNNIGLTLEQERMTESWRGESL